MEKKERLQAITKPIVTWYQTNGRNLPWREGKNPYHIWISEIMLQQTRIEAVKEYYTRFLEQIPTIKDLAEIEEEKLLKLWEGLGYYNRARNLKKAAIQIQEKGSMPTTYEELLMLPGIGEYTAGAISSIAFQEKVPAVDGNVLRVITRVLVDNSNVLLPETKKKITNDLKEIMPKEAGDFNEGIMELGELICLPNGTPLCEQCPIKELCLAYEEQKTDQIPVRKKQQKRKIQQRIVFLLEQDGKIAISKRPETGLLAGLYEFPNVEKTDKKIEQILKEWQLEIKEQELLGEYIHIFSHIEWHMEAFKLSVNKQNSQFLWVEPEEIENTNAIPTAFAKIKKDGINKDKTHTMEAKRNHK